MTINLNHAVGLLLAYTVNDKGEPEFVVEQKSPTYPRFPNRIGCFGGNGFQGIHNDKSGIDTLVREVCEEFSIIDEDEPAENISLVSGEIIIPAGKIKSLANAPYEEKIAQQIGSILLNGTKYGAEFVYTMDSELTQKAAPMVHTVTAGVRKLRQDEFAEVKKLLAQVNYQPTTDNRKFGSFAKTVTMADIRGGQLWHSAHDLVVEHLSRLGMIDAKYDAQAYHDPLRKHLKMDYLEIPGTVQRDKNGAALFSSLEANGVIQYGRHSKK